MSDEIQLDEILPGRSPVDRFLDAVLSAGIGAADEPGVGARA